MTAPSAERTAVLVPEDHSGTAAAVSNSAFGRLIERLQIEVDPELLQRALVHCSYAYEHGGENNERLEFLGDAVLDVIVAEQLYREHPDAAEGTLSKLRAAVVSAPSLAEVARELELGPLIKLGRGEIVTGGAGKVSILADTVEALIGAIYLSQGKDAVESFVHAVIDSKIDRASSLGQGLDWKTSLQELVSRLKLPQPRYEVTDSGPDHMKSFVATALVGEREFGPGQGSSKKQAELRAAAIACQQLQAEADAASANA